MRIIVIGCGRMGSSLAQTLDMRGHEVTVVDSDPGAFERLGLPYRGETMAGSGFDRKTLLQAGIERADCLAAVTGSDEVNAVSSRLARRLFRVPRVVARIHDARKAEVYRRMGLPNISPATWGTNRMIELLLYSRIDTVLSMGNGEVEIVETEIPELLVGRTVNELTVPGEIHVVAVEREGKTFLPSLGTEFSRGDLVHLSILSASSDRLKSILGWL